ncbi:MAG: mucoidy inhibitor MuiA family protein [Leptolyngbya sp. SIO1D8]|nr:mucoidy inhibitor MuiA family protein [Leptolyngbya sp. SIO1D8]
MQTPDSRFQTVTVLVETQIIAVTVYPNQARVTRQGQIQVVQQATTVEIRNLPASLQPDSLQAYSRGSAQVILQTPQIETVVESASQQAHEEQLTLHLHQLEQAFQDCKDRLAALSLQRGFLESLTKQSANSLAQGLSQQSISLEDLEGVLHFFEQSYQKIVSEIANHEHLKQDLEHQLQDVRQKLQQFHGQINPAYYRVLLPLIVEKPGTLDLDIVYDVGPAQWCPLYDVRLDEDLQNLQMDCIAQVQQNTGESWENVELKVSTALPGKNPDVSQTSLWYISVSQENRNSEGKAVRASRTKTRSPVLDETYRMLGAVPGSEIPMAEIEEEVGSPKMKWAHATITFSALEPATIANDNCPHRVLVDLLRLGSQLTYMALPQQYSAPYLQVHILNSISQRPLLPGTVHLFRTGGYLGQETLDYVAPGAPFQLNLGLDERISIKHELVARETQSGNQCLDTRSYRLTLHNPFTYPITINVVEQIPISQTDHIHVSLVKAEPQIFTSKPGLCQWVVRLDAQETQFIDYQYAIEYPCDMNVVGLDR